MNNQLSKEELTQKMYDLISDNVTDSFTRHEMFELLDEIEDRI